MNAEKSCSRLLLPFICLIILGVMPVLSNSRPEASDALGFALAVSFWQALFALPLFVVQLRLGDKGIFHPGLPASVKMRVWWITILTGILFGLATWCYILSLKQAGTANASIAIQAYPLFAVLTEMVMLRQCKSLWQILATAGLVAALYYLGTGGSWQIRGMSMWIFVALCVPFLWSIAHVLIREELCATPITPGQVTCFRVVISMFFLGLLQLVTAPGRIAGIFEADLLPWAVGMGLFYYLELVIWFYAIQRISVSVASAITAPWPGVTMILSWIVLGETIHMYQIISFAAVVICIYFLLASES